jgi:hypothetical protein
MAGNRQIIEAVQRMTGTQLSDNVRLLSATVDAVDEPKRTCTVTSISSQGAVTIENVQLMASVDDGMMMIPQIDSTVIIAYSTFNQPFVLLFSGLSKIVLTAGENDASVQIDDDGMILEIAETRITLQDGKTTLNDGAMGGLVKVIELTQKLNALENKVNALITAYNAHVHSGVTTGPGSSGPTPTQVSGTLTPTQRAEIENEKIEQG